jgi:predicted transcriptional regulator of viral defense system
MALDNFFSEHPVFRYEELLSYLSQEKAYKETTLKSLLHYHIEKKHITRIRRGYYAVIANKRNISTYDALLIAGRMNNSALIAYHSALTFHGIAYSLLNTVFFISTPPVSTFNFQQASYKRVSPPRALSTDNLLVETKNHDRLGLTIRVTTIERTLVDCLDKPQFAGGHEEIWRATSMIDFLDVERMINYAMKLGNATTIAKLGFFLEQHQEHFEVDNKLLAQIEKAKPKSTHYFSRGSRENSHIRRWNLMVPTDIKNKTWEERNDDI